MIPSSAEKSIAICPRFPNSRQKKPEVVSVSKPHISKTIYTILKTKGIRGVERQGLHISHFLSSLLIKIRLITSLCPVSDFGLDICLVENYKEMGEIVLANFRFIEKNLPDLYVFAANAEQTMDCAPLISLKHQKQMGQRFVKKILTNEHLKIENEEPLVQLEGLIKNEILPAQLISILKQLEYFNINESELFIDPSLVKRLLHGIYDLTCWYYKTYIDDNFMPSPMYLPSQKQPFDLTLGSIDANRTDYIKTSIELDGETLGAIWEDRIENVNYNDLYNNESYQGQMLNGMKHGTGIYRWSDGTKYAGQWNRDTEHGLGEKHYANGDSYRGGWKEGLFHGNGVYEWKDGTKFEGQWENNLEHGFGVKTYCDGSIHKGFWTYGEFSFTEEQLKEGQLSISEAQKNR